MSGISSHLSQQSFEMAIHLIASEILNSSGRHHNTNFMLASFMESSDSESSTEEDDLLYLALLKQVLLKS
jgi:hypothetical protein